MFCVIENSLNLDALYLVKLIFGEYFCYFDSNRIAVLLQLQLYLDANRVPVPERVNITTFSVCNIPSTGVTSDVGWPHRVFQEYYKSVFSQVANNVLEKIRSSL